MNWDNIKVGNFYFVNEEFDKYVIEVLENESDDEYWSFKVKPILGTVKPPFSNVFTISRLRTMIEGLNGVPIISEYFNSKSENLYIYGGTPCN